MDTGPAPRVRVSRGQIRWGRRGSDTPGQLFDFCKHNLCDIFPCHMDSPHTANSYLEYFRMLLQFFFSTGEVIQIDHKSQCNVQVMQPWMVKTKDNH